MCLCLAACPCCALGGFWQGAVRLITLFQGWTCMSASTSQVRADSVAKLSARSSQKYVTSAEKSRNQEESRLYEEQNQRATGLKKVEERKNRRPADVPARKCNVKLLLAVCLLAVCPCRAADTVSEVVFAKEDTAYCWTASPARAPRRNRYALCLSVLRCRFSPQQLGVNRSSGGFCSSLSSGGSCSSLRGGPCSDHCSGALVSWVL